MARYKLNEADEDFLKMPSGAALIASGSNGTETWIERDRDMVVHIAMKAVAIATADGGTLTACIDVGGQSAKAQDGPLPLESQLRAGQSVQVLVKAGQRLAFKAYPVADNAEVLKTVVWAADFKSEHEAEAAAAARAAQGSQPNQQPESKPH
ncbi:MAG TPA: hypothetical protein VHZ26_20585 [Caulobacteraceae bacterium]|jgi:hypothetical protein|nr:hypothetical protein [Caulobacteraceae bacterium]